MHKQYSIAEAKDHLPRLVRDTEDAGRIVLTRRGKPVAVMISTREYEKLSSNTQPRRRIWDAIQAWRTQYPEGVALTDDEIDSWRDRTPAREPNWLHDLSD